MSLMGKFLFFFFILNSTFGHEKDMPLSYVDDADELRATWADFQNKHMVLSPEPDRMSWNSLLRKRIGNMYGSGRPINTFIVGDARQILADFAATPVQQCYVNLYWSSVKRRIFVMIWNAPSKVYYVHDCNYMYYVTGVDSSYHPVHYEGHTSSAASFTVNVPPEKGCLGVS